MLSGKRILLGVTGSIAAYKSAALVRLLVKAGADVKVVMTPTAKEFVTLLTLSTLSKNQVLTQFVKDETGEWQNHIELGLWADALLIAPASANTIAKMTTGQCDNLLLAIYLSAQCQVFFAPAMDLDMLEHPSTQQNIQKLVSWGNELIHPAFGELASGLTGNGRMAEPEVIISKLESFFAGGQKLKGKRALVTAGPTHEAIDPVRFIGNNSSGKMGFAIAEALAKQGAEVDLVSGPTALTVTNPLIRLKQVTSADEMYQECILLFPSTNILVMSAAVADFKPAIRADQKIKKNNSSLIIELVKTKDIAAELGKMKKPGQFTVGFALETENEMDNAEKKIVSKNLDLIVLNSLNDKGAGFGHETNRVTFIHRDGSSKKFNLKSKQEVAHDIVTTIIENVTS